MMGVFELQPQSWSRMCVWSQSGQQVTVLGVLAERSGPEQLPRAVVVVVCHWVMYNPCDPMDCSPPGSSVQLIVTVPQSPYLYFQRLEEFMNNSPCWLLASVPTRGLVPISLGMMVSPGLLFSSMAPKGECHPCCMNSLLQNSDLNRRKYGKPLDHSGMT